MPIRPQHRWLYPIDWPQLSAVIRFERAKGRCEQCARPHGELVCHLGDGRWWDQECGAWRAVRAALPSPAKKMPRTRVYLATAHLDHDPSNSHPRNLAALCQRCHLIHDVPSIAADDRSPCGCARRSATSFCRHWMGVTTAGEIADAGDDTN